MRIISGYLKGRLIEGYDIIGTRPTMNRVKESLFAMIQNYLLDSTVLDLFAGSGSIGIEAISNKAKYCYFVDNNSEIIKTLSKNINNLKIEDKCKIIHNDYNEALLNFKDNQKFDLIFLDPPYKLNIIEDVLGKIMNYQLLKKDGLIIIECQNIMLNQYLNLQLLKQKKYSDKYIYIFKNQLTK